MREWQLLVFAALLNRQAFRQPSSAMPFAGPYIAYADAFSQCEAHESNHRSKMYLSVTKFDKKLPHVLQRITGNATLVYFDEKTWTRVRMDTRSKNQWKENAFIFNFPRRACSSIRENIPDFFRVMFNGDFMERGTCEIPTGLTFVVNDQPVNWTFPNFPIMPYGHWRFHLTMGKAEETSYCINVECHSIPAVRQAGKG